MRTKEYDFDDGVRTWAIRNHVCSARIGAVDIVEGGGTAMSRRTQNIAMRSWLKTDRSWFSSNSRLAKGSVACLLDHVANVQQYDIIKLSEMIDILSPIVCSMLLLALFLYYASAYNSGIAAPINSSIDSDNASLLLSRDTDTPDLCPRKRVEIIWSCIATILAASWVSVHPNLPHPKDSKVKKTLRRIELMLWAIITPELIIYWAMRQWYGARKMEREFLGTGLKYMQHSVIFWLFQCI